MTPLIPNPLTDSGEQDAIKSSESQEDLSREAGTPASVLYVKRLHDTCWTKKWIRNFRVTLAFCLGAFAALQVGGFFLLRASLREIVRTTTVEVLKEHKVISTTAEHSMMMATR